MATRTLFAGNLELNITEEEMKKIFGRYGKLVDIDIKRPPPGTGNAFAFVRYENLDMAHRAKQELSGQFIGKFQCKIGYGKANPTPKVWVGGLGSWCSESLLWKEFDRFGAIKSIDYQKGDSQAYILYEMLDAAQAAVQEMRGFPLGGPDKRLRIDFSDVDAVLTGDGSPPPPESNGSKRASYSGGRNTYEDSGSRGGDYYRRRESWSDQRERRSMSPDDVRGRDDDHSVLVGAQTVADICRKTPKVWDGGLILKNSLFPTRLHLVIILLVLICFICDLCVKVCEPIYT
jgi:RNA-binding protein 15